MIMKIIISPFDRGTLSVPARFIISFSTVRTNRAPAVIYGCQLAAGRSLGARSVLKFASCARRSPIDRAHAMDLINYLEHEFVGDVDSQRFPTCEKRPLGRATATSVLKQMNIRSRKINQPQKFN
jgi:hypothetical protein